MIAFAQSPRFFLLYEEGEIYNSVHLCRCYKKKQKSTKKIISDISVK